MGKPLISDAQMRAIHNTMLHLRECEAASTKAARHRPQPQPVALLAATLLQLRTEDVLVTQGDHPLAVETIAHAHAAAFTPDVLPAILASHDPASAATLAAGHALAQSRYSHPGDEAPVTVALLHPNAPIDEAMRLAGEHLLPLILLIRENTTQLRRKFDTPANVEAILIDAEDAVACCRVMQESLLRARNRWGSVVLRAATLPGTPDALTSMQTHLQRRNLAF